MTIRRPPMPAAASAARAAPRAPRPARGITLIGLLSAAFIVMLLGYVAVRVVPTVLEMMAIQRVVERIGREPPSTVAGIRDAFDRQREIDQTITAISGKDLDITKVDDRIVIGYAYEREIPLFGPAFLLLKYAGRSR